MEACAGTCRRLCEAKAGQSSDHIEESVSDPQPSNAATRSMVIDLFTVASYSNFTVQRIN